MRIIFPTRKKFGFLLTPSPKNVRLDCARRGGSAEVTAAAAFFSYMVIAHQNIFSRMGHLFKNTEQQQQQQQQKGRRRDFSLKALLFSFHEWKEKDQKLLCGSAIYFKHKLSRWLKYIRTIYPNSGEPRWMFFTTIYVYSVNTKDAARCQRNIDVDMCISL